MSDQRGETAIAAEPAASISCYTSEIPPFVKTELERLYSHLFSSLPFFETFRTTENVCTYVVMRDGQPSTILLFQNKGRRIDVLNEMIRIDEQELRCFVDYVFANFSPVAVISFKAIQSDVQRLPFPYQRHNSKEDFVIVLPDTQGEYRARIGSSTRYNVKRYMKRLTRDFPTFSYRFYENEEISEQDIREIIRLSEIRISAKKKRFGIDEKEVKQILNLARICGLVNVVSIDGHLCAGTITLRTGSSYLAMVNAHEPKYDGYWLGTLCYYLTICESIARGGKRFHMGGGRYDYKIRLLGVRQDMDHLEVYRSYGHALVNCDNVVKTIFSSLVRRTKVWLLDRETSPISQFVLRTLFLFRMLTRCTK
jgi:hypothetical protein